MYKTGEERRNGIFRILIICTILVPQTILLAHAYLRLDFRVLLKRCLNKYR